MQIFILILPNKHLTIKGNLWRNIKLKKVKDLKLKIAYFISYEPKLERPLVFRVGDAIWTRQKNGRHCDKCDGLVYPEIYLLISPKKIKLILLI